MEKGLEKFTIRELLIIIFPGLYFTGFAIPLIDSSIISSLDNNLANITVCAIISLMVGISLDFIDIPKKFPFFINNMPTVLLHKEFEKIEVFIIDNKFYSYYDNNASPEEKSRANIYTSLYHFCVNIFLLSFILLFFYIFKFWDSFLKSYGVVIFIVLVFSLINSFGLFYGKGKIKYLFKRQYHKFKESESYTNLIEKNKLK